MLISLLVAVIVIGLLIYLVQMLPLPDPWKTIAVILVILIALIWLLGSVGGGLGTGWEGFGCHR